MEIQKKIVTLRKKAKLTDQLLQQVFRLGDNTVADIGEYPCNHFILDDMLQYQQDSKLTAGSFTEHYRYSGYTATFNVRLD